MESATLVDAQLSARRRDALPAFLQRRIKFREAVGDESAHLDAFSYAASVARRGAAGERDPRAATEAETAGAKRRLCEDGSSHHQQQGSSSAGRLKSPARELFPSTRLAALFEWHCVTAVGPGLANMGNTCFLNSVLQCLTYTPPFANYLLSGEHGRSCTYGPTAGFCLMCELERHLEKCLGTRADRMRYIAPSGTVGHLRAIAKHMRVGRQEDAQEFLRFVIEALQRALLANIPGGAALDARTKETTLVHQIFGGHLESQVVCLTCKHTSSTFEAFMDLSLDLRQGDTVEKALGHFVRPELLTKGNKYRCGHCGRLSDAEKRMCIYQAPPILTVHLKRFHMSPYGETFKVNKQIDFEPALDLHPAMSRTLGGGGAAQEGLAYDLYAVLVHEGQSCNSGHYHAFVKASNGIWYSMNDSSVNQVSLSTVLKQRAYLLFYKKRTLAAPARSKEDGSPAAAPFASAGRKGAATAASPSSTSEAAPSNAKRSPPRASKPSEGGDGVQEGRRTAGTTDSTSDASTDSFTANASTANASTANASAGNACAADASTTSSSTANACAADASTTSSSTANASTTEECKVGDFPSIVSKSMWHLSKASSFDVAEFAREHGDAAEQSAASSPSSPGSSRCTTPSSSQWTVVGLPAHPPRRGHAG